MRRLAERLGYPGAVLVVFGWFWCWIGVGVAVNQPDYNPQLVHTHLPLWARLILWCGCGLASMVLAWVRGARRWGFFLLTLPPAERAFSFTVAVFAVQNEAYLVGMVVWLSMTFAVLLFAAWPEPPGRNHA